MRPFSLLKLAVLLLGFGALALFTPSCKAQSEVSPDHFDGTDPWEIAARKPVASPAVLAKAMGSYQALNKKADSGASLQLAAVREVSKSLPRKTVAVQDKRKSAVRKSDPK
jgi:hypothetical protein